MNMPFVPTDGDKHIGPREYQELLGRNPGAREWLSSDRNRKELKEWLRDMGYGREYRAAVDRMPRGTGRNVDVDREAEKFEDQVRSRGMRIKDAGATRLPTDWMHEEVNRRYTNWYEHEYSKTKEKKNKRTGEVYPGMSPLYLRQLKLPYGYKFRGMRIEDVPIQYLARLPQTRDWHLLPPMTKRKILAYLKMPGVNNRAEEYLQGRYERDYSPGGWEEIEDVAIRYRRSGKQGRKPYRFQRRRIGDFGVSDSWGRLEATAFPSYSTEKFEDIHRGEWTETFESNQRWVPWEGGFRKQEYWSNAGRNFEPGWMHDFDLERQDMMRRGMEANRAAEEAYWQTRPGTSEFRRLQSRSKWGFDSQGRAFRIPPSMRKEHDAYEEEWRRWVIQNEQEEYLDQRREMAREPGMPGVPADLDLSRDKRALRGFEDLQGDYLGRLERATSKQELLDIENDLQKFKPFQWRDMPEFNKAWQRKWNEIAGKGVM